jgi:hypothetical protein
MARLLIVAALIVFVVLSLRRALREGRAPQRPRGGSGSSRPPGTPGPPERLVCGACGAAFDPEKSGWICPKCGK